jgi:hypothetical protein
MLMSFDEKQTRFGLVTVWFRIPEWNNIQQGYEPWQRYTMTNLDVKLSALH